jgi:uncharacterized protein YmfQ (DUF2313 family)
MGIWTATTDDLLRALQGLLPRGIVWTRDADRRLTKYAEGLAVELARVHGRAGDMMDEADPQTTDEQLEDWRRVTGQPRCSAIDWDTLTDQQKRDAIVGQLAAQGGQSAAYFVALALSLGAVATVTDSAITFEWIVDSAEVTRFRAGTGQAGDPLVEFSDPTGLVMACMFERARPAHTRIHWTGP